MQSHQQPTKKLDFKTITQFTSHIDAVLLNFNFSVRELENSLDLSPSIITIDPSMKIKCQAIRQDLEIAIIQFKEFEVSAANDVILKAAKVQEYDKKILTVTKRLEASTAKMQEETKRGDEQWEELDKIAYVEIKNNPNLELKIQEPSYMPSFEIAQTNISTSLLKTQYIFKRYQNACQKYETATDRSLIQLEELNLIERIRMHEKLIEDEQKNLKAGKTLSKEHKKGQFEKFREDFSLLKMEFSQLSDQTKVQISEYIKIKSTNANIIPLVKIQDNNKREEVKSKLINIQNTVIQNKDIQNNNQRNNLLLKEEGQQQEKEKSKKMEGQKKSKFKGDKSTQSIADEEYTFNFNQDEIVKEGQILKRSRFLKKWRQRWLVVTKTHVLTFESRQAYQNPTESVNLSQELNNYERVNGHEVDGQHAFRVVKGERSIYFQAESEKEQKSWLNAIERASKGENWLENKTKKIMGKLF